jgi:hypothetical protein
MSYYLVRISFISFSTGTFHCLESSLDTVNLKYAPRPFNSDRRCQLTTHADYILISQQTLCW